MRHMLEHDPVGPQPEQPGSVPLPGGPPEPVTPILPNPDPALSPDRRAA